VRAPKVETVALPARIADDNTCHGRKRRRDGGHQRVETVEPDHVVDRGLARGLGGPRLCVAPGQDDARGGVLTPGAAREAAALRVGGVGHRAGVHDHDVAGAPRDDLAPLGAQAVAMVAAS